MRVWCASPRFTPGLKNAKDVALNTGDTVTATRHDGTTVSVTIDSDLLRHAPSGELGYEVMFEGERVFVFERWIIGWEGKS